MRLWLAFFFFLLTIPTIIFIPLGLIVFIKAFDVPGADEAFARLKEYNEQLEREPEVKIEVFIDGQKVDADVETRIVG